MPEPLQRPTFPENYRNRIWTSQDKRGKVRQKITKYPGTGHIFNLFFVSIITYIRKHFVEIYQLVSILCNITTKKFVFRSLGVRLLKNDLQYVHQSIETDMITNICNNGI